MNAQSSTVGFACRMLSRARAMAQAPSLPEVVERRGGRPRRRFSPVETAFIVAQFKLGRGKRAIARTLGFNESRSIDRVLRAAGVGIRHRSGCYTRDEHIFTMQTNLIANARTLARLNDKPHVPEHDRQLARTILDLCDELEQAHPAAVPESAPAASTGASECTSAEDVPVFPIQDED